MKEDLQSTTAERLKGEFDRAFAELPAQAESGQEALLALNAGGDPYALSVSEIRALARDRPIAPVPGSAQGGFLGLAGLRGALMPVWDLAQALGYARPGKAAWLAVSAAEPSWALAFEHFEGYLMLPQASLRPTAAQGPLAAFSSVSAVTEGRLRPVVDLGLLAKILQSKNPSMLKGTR